MPGDKETIEQFAARIKAKYPQYKGINDTDLVNRIVAKHPQYKDSVDFGSQTQTTTPQYSGEPKGSVVLDYAPANQRQRTDSRVPQPIVQPLPDKVQTVAEKHAEEVGAAQQRINSTLQKSDPAIKSLLMDYKKQQAMGQVQNDIQQRGVDATGHADLTQRISSLIPKASIHVSDEEVKDYKRAMETDPNLAREALHEHAKLNPADAKTIAADTYLLDSKDRSHNAEKILKNKQGIEKGELDYSIWHGGQIKKPEGFVQSLGRGFDQRQQQFNDYDFLSSAKDEDIVAEMEKRRTTQPNEDDPVPVAEGLKGGFGQMLGAEGPTMAKGALPGILSAVTGGGAAAAAPWLGALLTSPDFYERGYANSFNRHYNELRDEGHEPAEAVQIAKNRASFDAKADVAQGAVMTAAGVKMGLPATQAKFSTGFLGAVKSAAKELAASTPEAAAQGALGGLTQVAKNVHAGKDAGEGALDAALLPIAFHYGIGIIAKGVHLTNPELYKSAVDNMAKQPEEIVNKTIGEQVESGEITPEQANDVHLVIEDQRAQHQELLNKAKEIVAKGKVEGKEAEPMQHDALNNPEEFTAKLQEIAEKAHKGDNELLSEKYGDDLINVAKQLFPKEPAKLKMKTAAPDEITQTDEAAPEGTAPSEPVPFSNQQLEAAKGFLQQGLESGGIDPEYGPFLEHSDHLLNYIKDQVKVGKGAEMKTEFGDDLVALSQSENSYPIGRNIKIKDNATQEQSAGTLDVGESSTHGEEMGGGNAGQEIPSGASQPEAQSQSANQEGVAPPPIDDLPFRDEPGDESLTGIRNSITAKKIEEAGLTPVLQEAARKHADVWQEALNKVKKGYDTQTLINQLKKRTRPLTDTEDALLLIHQVEKESQLDAVNRQITEAGQKGDEVELAELHLQKAKIKDDLQDIYDVDKAVGAANARGLSARQMISDRKYSLVNMEMEARAAKDGKPLSEDEVAQVEKKYNEIKVANEAYQKRLAELEAENKAMKARETLKKATSKTSKEKKSSADYSRQRDEIVKKMREDLLRSAKGGEGLTAAIPFAAQLKAVAPHVAKLVKLYIEQGVDNIEKMTKEIYAILKPSISGLKESHVHDLIAGEFDTPTVREGEPVTEASIPLPIKEQAKNMKYAITDPETMKLRANYERAKEAWGDDMRKKELAGRSTSGKVQDAFIKWERAFKLSGITTMAKLAMAATTRLTTSPIEEGVGSLFSMMLPKVANKAAGEGWGSLRAEAKAISAAFTKGMKDSADILSKKTRGKSDIDAVFGKGGELPPEALSFFGQLHSATKAPVKRAAFERSLTKRIAANLKSGVDVSDPMVQAKIAIQAYKDGNRAIFMQDNFLSDSYRNFVNSIERSKKYPTQGKLAATALQWLIPFVKVPTNIVGEVGTNVGGIPIAAGKLLHTAFTKGLSSLSEEEADMIMRNLKKGSIGAGALLLGYFNPTHFGGYYEKYEKRAPGDLKAGQTRAFGMTIPIWLQESPIFQTMQLGATIRRVKDKMIHGEPEGITQGIWAGAMGLVEHEPLVDQPARIMGAIKDPKEREYFLGQLAKGTVVPAAISNIAQWTDHAETRKPGTILEHIETGIPFLRQNVPEKAATKVPAPKKKGRTKKREHRT